MNMCFLLFFPNGQGKDTKAPKLMGSDGSGLDFLLKYIRVQIYLHCSLKLFTICARLRDICCFQNIPSLEWVIITWLSEIWVNKHCWHIIFWVAELLSYLIFVTFCHVEKFLLNANTVYFLLTNLIFGGENFAFAFVWRKSSQHICIASSSEALPLSPKYGSDSNYCGLKSVPSLRATKQMFNAFGGVCFANWAEGWETTTTTVCGDNHDDGKDDYWTNGSVTEAPTAIFDPDIWVKSELNLICLSQIWVKHRKSCECCPVSLLIVMISGSQLSEL